MERPFRFVSHGGELFEQTERGESIQSHEAEAVDSAGDDRVTQAGFNPAGRAGERLGAGRAGGRDGGRWAGQS